MYALQMLHFPALRGSLETMEKALMPYVNWLETQWHYHDVAFDTWRMRYDPAEEGSLYAPYASACGDAVRAVVQAVPQSQKFARALPRPRKHERV
jgi:hypothetical protein